MAAMFDCEKDGHHYWQIRPTKNLNPLMLVVKCLNCKKTGEAMVWYPEQVAEMRLSLGLERPGK
jgi:hypothetical protein